MNGSDSVRRGPVLRWSYWTISEVIHEAIAESIGLSVCRARELLVHRWRMFGAVLALCFWLVTNSIRLMFVDRLLGHRRGSDLGGGCRRIVDRERQWMGCPCPQMIYYLFRNWMRGSRH